MDCGCHSGQPWYVALINPGVASWNGSQPSYLRPALHRMGFSTFLPLIREPVPGTKRTRELPAFGQALFVQWAAGAAWWRILSLPGVQGGGKGLVRPIGDPYGHPAPVPEELMSQLFARARDGGVIEDSTAAAILEPLEAGTVVLVLRGLLAGRTGISGLVRGQRVDVETGDGRRLNLARRDVEAI